MKIRNALFSLVGLATVLSTSSARAGLFPTDGTIWNPDGTVTAAFHIDEEQFIEPTTIPWLSDSWLVLYDVPSLDWAAVQSITGSWIVKVTKVSVMQTGVFDDPSLWNIEVRLSALDTRVTDAKVFSLTFGSVDPVSLKFAAQAYDIQTGKAVINTGVLDVPGSCAVDLNGDGVVDFGDYLEFLNLYDSGDLRVDFNGDGLVDFADYLEFLNLFDTGC